MANEVETLKERFGNPFEVIKALERAAVAGITALSEDELFMCRWVGLYSHRHEKEYFMLRTRQPNGFATPEQLDVIAEIIEKKNRGFADITTRQTFQLHWVHVSQAAEILARLTQAGISTLGACGDILRNVTGCPVAGVDRDELFDASVIAQQINEFFLGNAAYANLPRKYKIGVSACKTQCHLPEIQCVSFVGALHEIAGKTERGFEVRVGGGLSTQPFISQRMNVFVRSSEALEVAKAITDIWKESSEYRQKRHHARFKYLIHDWGVPKFREALEQRLGRKLEDAAGNCQEPKDAYRDHIGVHAQKQRGLFYVGVPVLVGRIKAGQLRKIADLSRRYGDGKTLRLTQRQNLLLLNIGEAAVDKVLDGLSGVGLSVNAHPIRRSVVTCTGTEFCNLAITETKARSRQIVEYLEQRVQMDEPLRLHVTGCPNACAQYQIANIGLMGSKTKVDGQVVDAFDILIAGQLGQGAAFNHAVLRKVPAAEVAKRLEQLLQGYKKQRKLKESFNDWSARAGDDELRRLLEGGGAHPLEVEKMAAIPKAAESDEAVY